MNLDYGQCGIGSDGKNSYQNEITALKYDKEDKKKPGKAKKNQSIKSIGKKRKNNRKESQKDSQALNATTKFFTSELYIEVRSYSKPTDIYPFLFLVDDWITI